MTSWTHEDEAQLQTVLERDHRTRPRQAEEITQARLAAIVLRRKVRRKMRGLTSQQKRAELGRRKELKNITRSWIKSAKKGGYPIEEDDQKAIKMSFNNKKKENIFLDTLAPNRQRDWLSVPDRIRSRERLIIDVENFSFFDDPNAVMSSLRGIALAETKAFKARINFHDEYCTDIGPWLTLAVMRRDMASVFTGGAISNSMSKILTSLKMLEELRFAVNASWSDEKDIWALEYIKRRAAGTSTSPTRHLDIQELEEAGERVADSLDEWLSEAINARLTDDGFRQVHKLVGEVLDNAERHARPDTHRDGDWMVSGFMATRESSSGQPRFHCYLAFLSIGASIAETVQGCDHETHLRLEEYCTRHEATCPGRHFQRDHLRTVFALQDDVTGDARAGAEHRNGTGFRDIIAVFSDLCSPVEDSGDEQKLAIVSGRTCLHITPSLGLDTVVPPSQKFNIWMNAENSEEAPPSPLSVIELEEEFRGTLISLSFVLDDGYFEIGEDDGEDCGSE